MINKFIIYILTKYFMKFIVQLLNQEDLVSLKLSHTQYKKIENEVGHIRSDGNSDYQLGQQSVLRLLRNDYVR